MVQERAIGEIAFENLSAFLGSKRFRKLSDTVYKIVNGYTKDLEIDEDFQRIFPAPAPIKEKLGYEHYRNGEVKFDEKLRDFVNSILNQEGKDWPAERKSQFVRWTCKSAVSSLLIHIIARQLFSCKNPRITESLLLTARRTLLFGAESTQQIQGITIDRQWLNELTSEVIDLRNIHQLLQPSTLKGKLERFVHRPPIEN
ncbi:hypothetical protein A2W70_01850 [Candidatus Curtissbacteria bacterium RIFCSPLOWO2_02_41_11]|uniref:Uncharacterized protein n=2 Tax=Candidatus Curtissiibacteriota TaxID=1752717 RepID=A0A1F5HSH3_9BACT|nr:MAG: hypothetical protein UU56_C0012G0039 [Candidatus Curtissbacteria bacterium GW2011_GWA2_41_24]OGD89551.1 MAG: hypothetical protein A2Z54_03395 [Candidatus Curtissbacteria bacterium RIFCSPHIGHO2_02_39_8]OGE07161.1 MAG: hypothetical protein A2W70_01850 [Candidatus Curtissbacteria bacterium RIFCSPLOWO2_02_41_11]